MMNVPDDRVVQRRDAWSTFHREINDRLLNALMDSLVYTCVWRRRVWAQTIACTVSRHKQRRRQTVTYGYVSTVENMRCNRSCKRRERSIKREKFGPNETCEAWWVINIYSPCNQDVIARKASPTDLLPCRRNLAPPLAMKPARHLSMSVLTAHAIKDWQVVRLS